MAREGRDGAPPLGPLHGALLLGQLLPPPLVLVEGGEVVADDGDGQGDDLVPRFSSFFSSLLSTRPIKLEGLHLTKTFQSSLTFAGNTRSLHKEEASERHSNWVGSGFALKL